MKQMNNRRVPARIAVMEQRPLEKREEAKSRKSSGISLIKVFSAIVFLLIASSAWAQDIITMKNGDEIKAVVQEIGLSEVKYKKFDNKDGPSYTLNKADVFMIKYANGSKDVFGKSATTESDGVPASTSNVVDAQKAKVTSLTSVAPSDLLQLRRKSIIDARGNILSRAEIYERLGTVPGAWGQYTSGRTLRPIGQVLFWVGAPVTVIGIIGAAVASTDNTYYDASDPYYSDVSDDDALLAASIVCIVGGVVCLVPGIILWSSGNKKLRRSVQTYNNYIKQNTSAQATLKFGLTQSGNLGFILNF